MNWCRKQKNGCVIAAVLVKRNKLIGIKKALTSLLISMLFYYPNSSHYFLNAPSTYPVVQFLNDYFIFIIFTQDYNCYLLNNLLESFSFIAINIINLILLFIIIYVQYSPQRSSKIEPLIIYLLFSPF